jgi:hypothetical protein
VAVAVAVAAAAAAAAAALSKAKQSKAKQLVILDSTLLPEATTNLKRERLLSVVQHRQIYIPQSSDTAKTP